MKVVGNLHKPKLPLDAGYDLTTPKAFSLDPASLILIDTDIHVELPAGSCGLIIGRSSLNKRGILCVVGLIDQGYTGSIGVALHNMSDRFVEFQAGDRIAQLVICPFLAPLLERVESTAEFEQTERGSAGFGSSGR